MGAWVDINKQFFLISGEKSQKKVFQPAFRCCATTTVIFSHCFFSSYKSTVALLSLLCRLTLTANSTALTHADDTIALHTTHSVHARLSPIPDPSLCLTTVLFSKAHCCHSIGSTHWVIFLEGLCCLVSVH